MKCQAFRCPIVLERMRKAEDGAAALEGGSEDRAGDVDGSSAFVQGVQVSAPFGKIPHALEVFEVL